MMGKTQHHTIAVEGKKNDFRIKRMNMYVSKRWRATWSFWKQFVYLLIRTYASPN